MDYTQRGLDRLMTPGNHWDPATPGLVLRIRESGAKTWSFVFRMGGRASKKQWLKLGDFSVLPLNRAQKRARDLRVQVENGIDPKKAIEEAANEGMTIEGLAEKFRVDYLPDKSTSTQEGYGSALDNYILPDLGKLSVRAITRDQIGKWHKKIEKPIAANRALAVLSCMMTLAIEEWGIREGMNPCLNVPRNPENPRLRDISKAELAAIGLACKDLAGEHSLFALAAVRVVLLCWGRVSEVLSLRRDRDTFLEEGYAMIRVHKTRGSSGDKRLELPPPAVKILRGLPKEKDNPHYFPGRAKGDSLTRNGLHKTWLAVCERAGIEDLHLHDSRSLAASEAEAQGINPKTGAALLGHKDARTTAKHYAKVRKAREAAAAVSAPIAEAMGE